MSTIIRTTDSVRTAHAASFNLDDLAIQAQHYLANVREQGAAILTQAQNEADAVRRRAEEEGRAAALRNVEAVVGKQMTTLLPALREAVDDIRDAKQAWLARWEAGAVGVATAIAQRLIRRELEHHPDITLDLVREAIELAAGSSQICIRLNPADHKTLGGQVRKLVKEMLPVGDLEVKSDADITPGGCRVDTRFGTIDQQFESQLKRIEEELLQ
jgi:flagellar assembly protein FliH